MRALAKLSHLRLIALASAAGLLSGGCADQPSLTESPGAGRPAIQAAARASGDAAVVIRSPVNTAALMFDFERNLTVLVGHTAAQLAQICGTGVFPETWIELDVLRPTGALHIASLSGEAPVVVYPGLAFDPCVDLLGVTPLAEGTGRGRYIDNDFFVNGPGAASFGLVVQGTVTELASGTPLHLIAHFRNVLRPDGTVLLPVIDVLMRPIGG